MKISKPQQYFIIGGLLFGAAIGYTAITTFLEDSSTNTRIVEFSDIFHSDIQKNSAIVFAKTSVPVICEVEYAEYEHETKFAYEQEPNNLPHLEHRVVLSGLKPDTQYNYRFQTDLDGTKFYSKIRSFNTYS